MNRRSFLIFSAAAAALALGLPGVPAGASGASAPGILSLENGRIVSPFAALNTGFGPDLRVTALQQSQGIWYASLQTISQPGHIFWLKSYNGRVWVSLDWQPRRNSPALT